MPRPKSEGLEFLTHGNNERNDRLIGLLFQKFDHLGRSVYYALLEVMCSCPGTRLVLLAKEVVEYVALQCHTTPEKLLELIEYAATLGLFDDKEWKENRTLVSDRLLADLEYTQKARERRRRYELNRN